MLVIITYKYVLESSLHNTLLTVEQHGGLGWSNDYITSSNGYHKTNTLNQ